LKFELKDFLTYLLSCTVCNIVQGACVSSDGRRFSGLRTDPATSAFRRHARRTKGLPVHPQRPWYL